MITIRVDTATNPKPNEIEQAMNAAFRKMMREAGIFGESQIAPKTPVGVSGHLRQGIIGRADTNFSVEFGVHGPGAVYGKFVEPGRKKGRFPPPEPIRLWVKRTDKGKRLLEWVKRKYRIKSNARALEQATFLKQRAIARRGTRGAFMFKKSIPAIQKFFERRFPQTIKEIEKELGD